MRGLGAVAAAGLLLAVTTGCGTTDDSGPTDSTADSGVASAPSSTPIAQRSRNVKQAEFGDAWPLTVKSGRVNCTPVSGGRAAAVFTTNDGRRFALNGTAKDVLGIKGIDPIWADDPNTAGLKKDISVLTEICVPS